MVIKKQYFFYRYFSFTTYFDLQFRAHPHYLRICLGSITKGDRLVSKVLVLLSFRRIIVVIKVSLVPTRYRLVWLSSRRNLTANLISSEGSPLSSLSLYELAVCTLYVIS